MSPWPALSIFSWVSSKPATLLPVVEKSSQPCDRRLEIREEWLARRDPCSSYLTSATFRSKCLWLFLYFGFNLAMTLHNKMTMNSFPYPYFLTGIHSLCNCLGLTTMWINGSFTPTKINGGDALRIGLFSILYSINIAVSNSSLGLVTVPIHQVTRSLTPLMVVGISIAVYHKRFTPKVYYSLAVISFGVGLATFGEYKFRLQGLLLTLLGAFLAALKTTVTTAFLKTAAKLSPLDLLFYLSPLALLQMIFAVQYNGEWSALCSQMSSQESISMDLYYHLALNGAIALGLNIVSFTANKNTGAVAISVAANIKQVMTILLSIVIFNLSIGKINAIGIAITLLGGIWYAQVEFARKKVTPGYVSPPASPMLQQDSHFEHQPDFGKAFEKGPIALD